MAERTLRTPVPGARVAGTRPITAADVRAPGAAREPLRVVAAHAPGPWWNALAPKRLRSLAAHAWVARVIS